MYQPHIVRYSLTTAVTECSEWTPDNTGRSSTCCLYTHTHTHTLPKKHTHPKLRACGHTLVISEPRLLSAHVSALSKLFQPGTIQQVTDTRERLRCTDVRMCVCVSVCVCGPKCLWPVLLALRAPTFFLFSEQTFVSVCVCVRFCVCVAS